MTNLLSDYLAIYKSYPANAFLSKTKRKERHCALMKWAMQEYQSMPNLKEIIAFININDTLQYEQPFFIKAVIPCVKIDINEGNIKAIRFLFECNGKDDRRIGTARDYVFMFCLATDFQNTQMELADMVLIKEPDNEIVLYYKYMFLKRILLFSIHEVPRGVLSGMNCAEREHLPYMKKELSTFVYVSKKLCEDDKYLIQECTMMYAAWEQYLDSIGSYINFEDYLIKHNIAYRQ